MLTFDRKRVTDQIELLPKRLRVAFAAAYAQRQILNYVRTSAANPSFRDSKQIWRSCMPLRGARATKLRSLHRSSVVRKATRPHSLGNCRYAAVRPGQNGNPAGRPRGSRNKRTIIAEQLLTIAPAMSLLRPEKKQRF
jgi:hypothetical protein